MPGEPIVINTFLATTLGLLTYLTGAEITRKLRILRDFNIPEPVTGGLVAALIALGIFVFLDRPVEFELGVRDYLLVVFFAGIGLNARLSDLISGGKPLLILLALTLAFILAQNMVGVATALGFGLPGQVGILMGSASLIGGHGTAIAWAPEIGEQTGFENAMELGVASATIGLVLAALIGGPIARYLIGRYKLTPARPDEDPAVGLAFEDEARTTITHIDLMRVMLMLHIILIIGYIAHGAIATAGLKLPLFVPCLLAAIVVGNLMPLFPRLPQVSRTPALSLVSDFALGIFLAMSLMALQLWTLQGMGLLLLVAMTLQTALAVAFTILLVFRFMGAEYRAAVLSAGFGGFALGATPTAIANMNAVTKRYGPSPIAFVILPLVSAFFVDLANAVAIQMFLAL